MSGECIADLYLRAGSAVGATEADIASGARFARQIETAAVEVARKNGVEAVMQAVDGRPQVPLAGNILQQNVDLV